ncbi:LysM peptidoglycan-binding domain-containing protein [Paenibacillus naphthalenovorans]|uniref:LysM peptidoglycan-binding domain-containing protein n=1 Tax=Paenibacillus naphthalenovorans TaxID=162209 RepID=UPI003D2E75BB
MANRYGIWLSWNNQQEGFELPILPSEIGSSVRGDGAGHDVAKFGKINVIKDRQLQEYTIESFFPARPYPFVTASVMLEPKAYVDYILKWWETKRPIRFVYVGSTMEINTAASIEGFEWKEVAGSPGDIQFSLQLKEYRFYEARRVVVQQQDGAPAIQKEGPKRPDDREPAKNYTLAAGDNLWKVAQKMLGDGSRWREIQQLNNLTDAQIKSLPVGLTLKLPEQGGAAYA